MTEKTASPLQRVAIDFHREELVLQMSTGETVLQGNLSPEQAIELASKLLAAGVEHANRRAVLKLQADKLADETLHRASH